MPLAFLFGSLQFLILFILGCILVGWYGRNTRIGYWGYLILSFAVTPVVTFLFIYFSTPRKKKQ